MTDSFEDLLAGDGTYDAHDSIAVHHAQDIRAGRLLMDVPISIGRYATDEEAA